jgi:hypothetical protein
MTSINSSTASGYLGSYAPYLPGLPDQLVLTSGSYTMKAPGGADVKAFSVSFNIPTAFNWTNRSQTVNVVRAQPLTIAWTGAAATTSMAVIGVSVDLPANASAIFYCVAPPNVNSFTVPADMLSVLPPTHGDPLKSKSVIFLANSPPSNATPVNIPGINAALAEPTLILGKTVVFQ